jgi:hypothetical protein
MVRKFGRPPGDRYKTYIGGIAMAVWKSASDLQDLYAVSEERLEAFARRGNLPFRREASGAILYEEGGVARLFRSRGGGLTISAEAASNPGFGVLGAMRLGAPAPGPASTVRPTRLTQREVQARAYQAARTIVQHARRAG